jgi:hypothetical protein
MGKQQHKEGWDTTSTITLIAVALIIGAVFISVLVSSSGNEPKTQPAKSEAVTEDIADEVGKALDKLGKGMKTELASTSYRGEIIKVNPDGKDGVKIDVSTYFEDSGDGDDGGQGIARRIFSNICLDVPELQSLYVISGSGLESKSVYRSDIPAC